MLYTLTAAHLVIGIWTQRDILPQNSFLLDSFLVFLDHIIIKVHLKLDNLTDSHWNWSIFFFLIWLWNDSSTTRQVETKPRNFLLLIHQIKSMTWVGGMGFSKEWHWPFLRFLMLFDVLWCWSHQAAKTASLSMMLPAGWPVDKQLSSSFPERCCCCGGHQPPLST